ncbi:alpha/beta hydrolase [Planctomicrobium sp. SH664]|uniref:alpha/beta hydrolase n=1 Tax=Planctomicrobium sp. SH664 TaxID=3448125 RepID=UPI003F5B4C58
MRSVTTLLQIICLLAMGLPVWADDTPLLAPDVINPTPAVVNPAPEHRVDLPPTPELPSPGETPAPAPPQYWIASSRCSVQNFHESGRGNWGLNLYERAADGQLLSSSMQSMTNQLVPGVPVCIFVHGSFVEWKDVCNEGHAAYSRIRGASNAPLQTIIFTWPSDGPRTGCFPVDVAVRGRQADFNGFHLAYLISQIPPSCPVSMIGHSHGARVIFSAMHLACGGDIEGYRFPYSLGAGRRYRIVVAAAALDHNWLNPGQQFGYALNPVECVLNLRNRHDLALSLYPVSRPFAGRALARSGFTRWDKTKLGPNAAKVRDYDVTEYVGHHHFWPFYYNQPAVIAAAVPYLYFY